MSYYHERKIANAKAYLAESEAKDRAIELAKQSNSRLVESRAWLDQYRTLPRPTRFNWAPRWPFKPPGDESYGEIIEGDYAVVADAIAAGKDSGPGASEEAARAGSGAAQEDSYETPF